MIDHAAIIKDVTYKPGWELVVFFPKSAPTTPHLHLGMRVPDKNTGARQKTVAAFPIPAPGNKQDFLDWVLRKIIWMETHEAKEMFKYQGKIHAEPWHQDPAKRKSP